ncbi:CRISPR-associated endoribonuclease Cas6 [Nodosilinea sp. LEGE 07298]|nr:CRISPR-associated endoribonuclease Cas6 [Nodosilinea sp. LEGE 07298]
MTPAYPLALTTEHDTLPKPPKATSVYSLVVLLGAAGRGRLPTTLGRAIHAQVLVWLQAGDPTIAQAIHSTQTSPISLSGLVGKRRKHGTQPDDEFYFRISLLDGDLLQPLLAGIDSWGTKPISLGNFPFVCRGVEALPGGHRQVQMGDYRLLEKTSPVSDDIFLEFQSPTAFKQGKRTIQPFPLPELVFGSLLRRWNAFAPEDLHFPQIEWQGMVSAFDLKTQVLRLEGGPQIGSVGWVRYRFPDAGQAHIASILAQYAFFAGVGYKTTMGMGQVQPALTT